MQRLDHVAFEVSDMDASIRFYAGKLGLKLRFDKVDAEHGERFAFFDLDGAALELVSRLGAEPYTRRMPQPPYCPHVALATDDIDATVRFLHERDIPMLKGPMEIRGQVRWIYASDPDGNVIEFVEWCGATDS